jgi:hypothetical protein
VFLPHPLDVPAVLLGVFLLMRKSEVRAAECIDASAQGTFDTWREQALAVYTFGSRVCFGKVFVDLLMSVLVHRVTLPVPLIKTVGIAIDVGWVGLLIWFWIRARAVSKLKGTLTNPSAAT